MRRFLAALPFLLALSAAARPLLVEDTAAAMPVGLHFHGGDILLYGALDGPGDVVVRVVSPPEKAVLSLKKATGPFWLDEGQIEIDRAPGLFYLLSSRPLEDLLPLDVRRTAGLDFDTALAEAVGKGTVAGDWRKAFLARRIADGDYLQKGGTVNIDGGRLFSTHLQLPARLSMGNYDITVFLVQNGQVTASHRQTLKVEEVALEAWIGQLADGRPWTFGIGMTLLALSLGFGLSILLRRMQGREK